ncbi:unnamed protein product [Lactuca virosa]|uniref:S-protein homolog n=1 Tax=Lactuca virosa TaxID=75947 RepID=A0AAU9NQ96_9ASTR|nr:unnamed protein product [Lactuca virosa]
MKVFIVFVFLIVIISRSVLGIPLATKFQTPGNFKQYNISINDEGLWALGFECQLESGEEEFHLINPGDESIIEVHVEDNDVTSVPCLFYWSKKDRNVHVFDQNLKKHCGDDLVNTCKWKISSDAFYIYDVSQDPPDFVKIYDW